MFDWLIVIIELRCNHIETFWPNVQMPFPLLLLSSITYTSTIDYIIDQLF